MQHNFKFILGVALFLSVSSFAADMGDQTLSWNDCVKLALQRNPDLIAAQKSYQSSQAKYRGSFNGVLPQLALSNSYNTSDLSDSESDKWESEASASMSLFNLRAYANIKSASAAAEQARAAYVLSSANVRFGVKQAYANLLYAQRRIVVSEKIRQFREGNANMISLTYDSGQESKGDMMRSIADLKQAEADLASARRDEQSAERELDRQLGLDEFSTLSTTGTLTTQPLLPLPDPGPLVDHHPQVLQAEWAEAISNANLRSAESDLWPYLTANYSRTWLGQNEFPTEPHWQASGVLSYNIFGSGLTSTFYAVSAARRSLEQVDANLRSVRNQVRSTIETSWANLADSIDQVAVQSQYLDAANQRNDESQIRYTSGLISYQDWALAGNDLVNFEKGLIQAQLSAVVAEATWEQAIGKTLEDK